MVPVGPLNFTTPETHERDERRSATGCPYTENLAALPHTTFRQFNHLSYSFLDIPKRPFVVCFLSEVRNVPEKEARWPVFAGQ